MIFMINNYLSLLSILLMFFMFFKYKITPTSHEIVVSRELDTAPEILKDQIKHKYGQMAH